MATPMRQGLRGGQPTDWGRGLAHMLRQWQGGKQLREAKEQLKVNKETEGRDWDKLLAIAGNEMATSGLGPLKQDAPMESEVGKQAALSQALKRADRKQGHADALELAEKRYGKGGYGNKIPNAIQVYEYIESLPTKEARANFLLSKRGREYLSTNDFHVPVDAWKTPSGVVDPLAASRTAATPPQGSLIPPMPLAAPLEQVPDQTLARGGVPTPQTTYQPQPETTEPAIAPPVTPQQTTAKALREGGGAVEGAIKINLKPSEKVDYVSEAAKAKKAAELSAIKDSEVGGAAARAQGLYANSQRLIDKTTQLLDHPGFDTSFGASAYLDPRSHLPGTDSTDAQAIRSTIVDQIFVESLQSMRALNKSGGAVGNVSDKEGDRMENQMVAVKKAQSDEQARSEFEKLVEMQKEAQQRIKDAFRLDYGDRIPLDEIFAPPKDVKSMSDDDLFN